MNKVPLQAATRSPSVETWLTPGLLALAVLVVFGPALRNGFVWDDHPLVVSCAGIKALDLRHLRWMLTTSYMSLHQPLFWLSLALDYRLWGLNPAGFHLTNVLLHAANAVVFYGIAALLLRLALKPTAAGGADVRRGAAFAALFFALHPLRAESVAWVSERRDVLCGLFYFLSLSAYLRTNLRPAPAAAGRGRLAWSLGFFILALLSKPICVTLPVVLLILDYYPLGRLGGGPRPLEPMRTIFMEKLPFFIAALLAGVLAVRAQAASGNLASLEMFGPSSRLAQSVCGLAFYLRKTFVPTGLSPWYALSAGLGIGDLRVWSSVLTLAAAVLGLKALGLERRAQVALWAYYAALLLPVLGLLQNGPQSVALRYSYLSCLGWAVLAGAGAAIFGAERRPRRVRIPALAAAVLCLSAAGWRARCETAVWRDDESFWTRIAQVEPGSFPAHYFLGERYFKQGRLEEAARHLEEALRLKPDGRARSYLAGILMRQGRLAQAEAHWREAVRLEPGDAGMRNGLGIALALQGRRREAGECFKQALRLDGSDVEVRANLERLRAEPQ